jgi:periplasmic protein TonB
MKSSLLIATLFLFGALVNAQDANGVFVKVDQNPVPLKIVSPQRIAGQNGLVAVVCIVDEAGKVLSAAVAKSNNTALEKPALEAIQQWGFTPAKKDGKSVKSRVTIPIRFEDQV